MDGIVTRDLDAIMSGRNKSPVQQAWEGRPNSTGWPVAFEQRAL